MFSYFTRLEALIEKWQLRRHKSASGPEIKSLEVSGAQEAEGAGEIGKNEPYHESSSSKSRSKSNTSSSENSNNCSNNNISSTNSNYSTLFNYPSIIYLLVITISWLVASLNQVSSHATPMSSSGGKLQSIESQSRAAASLIGKALVERLLTRDRWISVPVGTINEGKRPLDGLIGLRGGGGAVGRWRWPVGGINNSQQQHQQLQHRPSANHNQLMKTLNRISDRIGSRNAIRVHNAFRDLAWRFLAGLSMPTPVIYELRRQNLYSSEDDLMNDSLYNKNTSKSIRSRTFLSSWPKLARERLGEDDDDDGGSDREDER